MAEDVWGLSPRYGYAVYAAVGALAGAATMFGFQMGTPWSVVAAAVVGALIGAAVRDAL